MNNHTIRRAAMVDAVAPIAAMGAAIAMDHDADPSQHAAALLSIADQARGLMQDAARYELSRHDVLVLCRAVGRLADSIASDVAGDLGLDLDSVAEAERFDSEAVQLLEAIDQAS